MDVDTRHLRALVAVVEEGTFTDAAIALRTSQASITRSVQRLEAVVGQRLLSRSTRHVDTTPAGDRVLVHARRILAGVAQLEAAVAAGPGTLTLGYAWAAFGEHTVAVQRAWDDRQSGDLVLVQHNTPTAGLLEGRCDVSLVRLPVTDPRLDRAQVGTERRYAVLAADHARAGQGTMRLADLAGETVAVDVDSGTTTEGLWGPEARPAGFRMTHGVDEWLNLIASGRVVGVSSEATAALHPRHGVAFRPLEDAPLIEVWLVWWKDDVPPLLDELVEISRAAYARAAPPQSL